MYRKAQPAKSLIMKKVLIVEPDRLTRIVLSKILSNYLSCEVNIASNKHEGESFIRSVAYDLYVLGMSKNIEDDLDIIRQIRDIDERVQIVAVTGDSFDDDIELIKGVGIDKIVYKPLKLTPFLEIVAGAFIESERVFNYA